MSYQGQYLLRTTVLFIYLFIFSHVTRTLWYVQNRHERKGKSFRVYRPEKDFSNHSNDFGSNEFGHHNTVKFLY